MERNREVLVRPPGGSYSRRSHLCRALARPSSTHTFLAIPLMRARRRR